MVQIATYELTHSEFKGSLEDETSSSDLLWTKIGAVPDITISFLLYYVLY